MYLNFVTISEPFDGWRRETRNFASQPQILLSGNGQFGGFNFLDDPWWFGFTQNVQHGISLAFASGVLDQKGVLAVIFIADFGDPQGGHDTNAVICLLFGDDDAFTVSFDLFTFDYNLLCQLFRRVFA